MVLAKSILLGFVVWWDFFVFNLRWEIVEDGVERGSKLLRMVVSLRKRENDFPLCVHPKGRAREAHLRSPQPRIFQKDGLILVIEKFAGKEYKLGHFWYKLDIRDSQYYGMEGFCEDPKQGGTRIGS